MVGKLKTQSRKKAKLYFWLLLLLILIIASFFVGAKNDVVVQADGDPVNVSDSRRMDSNRGKLRYNPEKDKFTPLMPRDESLLSGVTDPEELAKLKQEKPIDFRIKETNIVTIPKMSGEANVVTERKSPEDPIIPHTNWMEFYTSAANAHNPALCDAGIDTVVGFNDELLVRCRSIASGNPKYCSYFDQQPNAKMDTIVFQQVCMYEVFRFYPYTTKFSSDSCESMRRYSSFMFVYLECLAIIHHDANYCVQLINMNPTGQLDAGPEAGIRCMATLANYLRSKPLCKAARQYEAYYLDKGMLNLPMDDELYDCPQFF
jgi:hypothetical protein